MPGAPRSLARTVLATMAACGAVVVGIGGGRAVAANELKVGDKAPEFSLPGSDGRTHTLGEHRGRHFAALVWWTEHYDVPQIRECVLHKVTADEDSAKRMGDKVNPLCPRLFTFTNSLSDHSFAQLFDRAST